MMSMCPFCGHELVSPLTNGISSCQNCRRTFDSSRKNRLLSASWFVRRKSIYDVDTLVERYKFQVDDAEWIIRIVYDECRSHDEILKMLVEV